MASGKDQLMEPDAVAEVLQIFHDYVAPDALALVRQDVTRFLQFKHTAQTILDLQPRKSGIPEASGWVLPGSVHPNFAHPGCNFAHPSGWVLSGVPILRIQVAFLPRADKSLALASVQGSLWQVK